MFTRYCENRKRIIDSETSDNHYRYLLNQNFVHQLVYFIRNVHIQIVNGFVTSQQLIIKMFVEQVYFIILT